MNKDGYDIGLTDMDVNNLEIKAQNSELWPHSYCLNLNPNYFRKEPIRALSTDQLTSNSSDNRFIFTEVKSRKSAKYSLVAAYEVLLFFCVKDYFGQTKLHIGRFHIGLWNVRWAFFSILFDIS